MRDSDILTERNVIIQELKNDSDDIDEYISDTIECKIFEGHPLERTIGGTLKTLDNINQNELLSFHKKYYRKDNLLITFSGHMKPIYTNIINKYFSKSNSKSKSNTKTHMFIPIDIKQQTTSTIIPYHEKNLESTINCFYKKLKQDHIHIIFKTKGIFDPYYYHYKILGNILGGNMSSRLFIEIREKLGLVYSINCSITNYEEVGYFAIDTQNENKDTLKCIKSILLELDKIKGHPSSSVNKYSITEVELKESKKNYCDIFISNFDDIEYENNFYSNQILYNKLFKTPADYIDNITNITVSDITNVAIQLFDCSKMHILTFGNTQREQIQSTVHKYCKVV